MLKEEEFYTYDISNNFKEPWDWDPEIIIDLDSMGKYTYKNITIISEGTKYIFQLKDILKLLKERVAHSEENL